MALPTAPSPTFHPFTRLPLELRLKIWETSLPDLNTPSLVFFRERTTEDLEAASWEENADNPLGSLPVHVSLPHVFVNREARRVALRFSKKSGLRMQFRPEIRAHAFFRSFSLEDDILYIPRSAWEKFDHACFKANQHVWLYGRTDDAMYDPSYAENIAVSVELASNHIFARNISQTYSPCHHTLHIIFDTPPEMEEEEEPNFLSGESWELRSTTGEEAKIRFLEWDHRYGSFYFWNETGDGTYMQQRPVRARVPISDTDNCFVEVIEDWEDESDEDEEEEDDDDEVDDDDGDSEGNEETVMCIIKPDCFVYMEHVEAVRI